MTRNASIALSLIVLIAVIVGIGMNVSNYFNKQHAAEQAKEDVMTAQQAYNEAIHARDNYLANSGGDQ
jgi:Na+-transporting methylmalonyl-CoA/oxaloacetate decarboxylase gamma subunit